MLHREEDYVKRLSAQTAQAYVRCRKSLISEIREEERREIYHYTSAEGFYNIIRNRQFFLTDAAFLNDSTEMASIVGTFLDALNDIQGELWDDFYQALLVLFEPDAFNYVAGDNHDPDFLRYFVLACSLEEDSLSLWNYYAKNGVSDGGYNMAFDKNTLLSSFQERNKEFYNGEMQLFHGRIIYEERKKREIIKDYLKGLNQVWQMTQKGCHDEIRTPEQRYFLLRAVRASMKWLGVFYKHQCFENEREYRFVLVLPDSRLTSYTAPREGEPEKLYKVRFTNNMFTPYVKLSFCPGDLKGVCLSPLCETYTAESYLRTAKPGTEEKVETNDILQYGVHEFLRINGCGLTGNRIRRSAIPLRF